MLYSPALHSSLASEMSVIIACRANVFVRNVKRFPFMAKLTFNFTFNYANSGTMINTRLLNLDIGRYMLQDSWSQMHCHPSVSGGSPNV